MNIDQTSQLQQPLQYKDSLKLITNALNKASKSGTFLLDESYIIKLALMNLEKALEVLEPSQPLSQAHS